MNRGNNRIGRGPAWAEGPFHTITHEFWPDLIKLREEAIAVREYNEHRLIVQVPNGRDDVDDVVLTSNLWVIILRYCKTFGKTSKTGLVILELHTVNLCI